MRDAGAGMRERHAAAVAERRGDEGKAAEAVGALPTLGADRRLAGQAGGRQQRIQDQAVARADAAKAALLEAELRVASVTKLIERRRADAALLQQQREQKATDEFASRMAWQRAMAAGAVQGL